VVNLDDFIRTITSEINGYNHAEMVRVEFRNSIAETITIDANLLESVVLNLIENSIVFRGANDPFVLCIFHREADQFVLKVMDNGIGISLDDRDKIFNMFYRGSERSTGNGLGLFMVKKTIEVLHGTIGIESELNQFTSVTIKIPLSN
ncbi:MAG: HAMP domain-containing sensor histidine kinase, partial [Chryseolinea sp.]